MPEYPAAVIGHDGKWVKPPDDDDDDSGSVPSADYVDDGANSGSGTSSGKGGGDKSGDSGGRRLGYSIQQHKSDAAVAAASTRSGPVTRPDDYRPFSDFIVSVLQTVQLTPRAILKKSKGKSEARAAKTTTVQPESDGDIPRTY
uniref:Uncharacterized protein n=1 Tax=Schizaphis graminum TaxID=13262 RepID=A0A2S2PQF0_SCHGA